MGTLETEINMLNENRKSLSCISARYIIQSTNGLYKWMSGLFQRILYMVIANTFYKRVVDEAIIGTLVAIGQYYLNALMDILYVY